MRGGGFIPSILPYRKFASRIFLPQQPDLVELGEVMPFGFVVFDSNDIGLPNGIASQDVAYGNASQPQGCWITHFVASSWLTLAGAQAAGITVGNFAVQFYDATRQKLWNDTPIPFANALGAGLGNAVASAKIGTVKGFLPFILKKPYRLPADGSLQTRVINLSTDTNQVQIVAWGYRS